MNGIFLTEHDEIEKLRDFLKIPSCSKERHGNGPKINLVHAYSEHNDN
jgi:hypothetical protein